MKSKDFEFKDWEEKIANKIGKSEWLKVFALDNAFDDVDQGCFYGALISNDLIESALKKHSWEVHSIDGGKPGFVTYYDKGNETTEYYRFSPEGIENLVYWRTFTGLEDNYLEISEEFRLFHDLYEKEKQFFHFDDNGDKHLVAEIKDKEVQIKKKYLKKFISAKNMSLMIYFEFMRFSKKGIEELGFTPTDKEIIGEDYIFSLLIRDLNGFGSSNRKAQGWILGKKLIRGIKDYEPEAWGDEKQEYENFIIGIDDDGNEIDHTCNEDFLANYFGKNPDSPHYLTPVYFRRDVLGKYYANPENYEVSDGLIRRTGFWTLRVDNNQENFVNVFLGDLGKLSHKEQLYWKSFNVHSESGISHANWERSFQGRFSDPNVPDLYFKYAFRKFQRKWHEKYSWHLFKPLNEKDFHHMKSLRVPLKEEQKEFDEQVLSLTKILIDSINEKELKKHITTELKDNAKGIDKFEAFLESKSINLPDMIKYLRDLQDLRSTGSAHRKSSKYEKAKAKFELTDNNYQETFGNILIKAIMIFNTIGNLLIEENYTQQSI